MIPRVKTLIETERLLLREFELDDAHDVLRFATNPEVTRYTGDAGLIETIDDARRLIVEVWHSDYRKHGFGRLAVVDKATNKVIGFCGLKYLEDLDAVDIGYRFLPEYWGRGIATEAAAAAMRHGHEILGLTDIIGLVMPDNLASHRVLKKLGMRQTEQISMPESDRVCVYRR
jgi:RimJ/RimL family protein N-acetyltransferase